MPIVNLAPREVMFGVGGAGDPLLLQRRARMMDTYMQLQQTHPALPPICVTFRCSQGLARCHIESH